AFAPHYSDDGQRIVYLSDRLKLPSNPQNLRPNDLAIFGQDLGGGAARRLVVPVPYSGGDSDPALRPGANEQLLYTTYLYGGAPHGSAIAFLMLVNGSFDLFILPVAGTPDGTIHATGPAKAVTHGSFLDADSRLAWSP